MKEKQYEEELEKEIELVSEIKNIRRNFTRLSGQEFYNLMVEFKKNKTNIVYLNSLQELYDTKATSNVGNAYAYTTLSECKLIYYTINTTQTKGFQKKQVMISFREKSEDPSYCIQQMNDALKKNDESLGTDPSSVTNNKVFGYYNARNSGKHTVTTSLDMNSAYVNAFKQLVADWKTRTLCSYKEVKDKSYDYYQVEREDDGEITYRYMYYKENIEDVLKLLMFPNYKVYGYKGMYVAQKTLEDCYNLRFVDKNNYKKWKNIMVIYIGTMHKRSGKNNRATIASSIYAWMEWYMGLLVKKFKEKGYKVILVNTDAIKFVGTYNNDIEEIVLGEDLGQFKIEHEGTSNFISEGHYEEGNNVKWKGVPEYMRKDGAKPCEFKYETIDKEREIYYEYAK